jgi:nucleoside-diphosphate-sugar epimerase
MPNKSVLITGATGFVGNRLTERLALGSGYNVTAAVHRFSGPGLARLARLPVKLALVDVLDRKSLESAAVNCDFIVHLAYGTSGDEDTKRRITVSGTENILKVALKNNVSKVVHLSTAAVHGIDPKIPVVDETAPFDHSHDVYRKSKIEAEKIVWQYHQRHGIPVVVFRPPIIYGPYGNYWTARIVKEIQAGAILVNGGIGTANLVYIDNLVDAVLLAIEKDSGDGEPFLVVSHPPIRYMSEEEIETMSKGDEPNDLKSWLVSPFLLLPEMVKTSLRCQEMRSKMMRVPWLRFVRNRLPRHKLDNMKHGANSDENVSQENAQSLRTVLPSADLVKIHSSQARFSNEKIKKTLGYKQRISFREALDLIYSWLKYKRLV